MKISYLHANFGHTGGSVVLYNFMDRLCARGHEVFAVLPDQSIRWRTGFSAEILRHLASKVRFGARLRNAASWRTEAALKRYAPSVLRWRADLLTRQTRGLLANWIPSDVTISTWWATSYANFALMDKTIPLYHMQHYEELFETDPVSQKAARLTYFMPLALVANCTWLREQIRHRIGRESHLLTPAIDHNVFRPGADVNGKYANPSKVRIVSYYSPVHFKAWDDAVEAMRLLNAMLGPDTIEWVVFGGQPKTMPDVSVTFVGRIFGPKLAELYSSAQIVFMNSWYESFPLPPLEAMACGSAVVTTPFGTEDYAFDGSNSLVVPPRRPEALAEALALLANDLRLARSLASAGSESAHKFQWDAATDRLEEILADAKTGYSPKFSDVDSLVSRGISTTMARSEMGESRHKLATV